MTRSLTEQERNTLVHGLRVSAEVFEKNVADLENPPDIYSTTAAQRQVAARMALQFKSQQMETRELADLIEGCENIVLQGLSCQKCKGIGTDDAGDLCADCNGTGHAQEKVPEFDSAKPVAAKSIP